VQQLNRDSISGIISGRIKYEITGLASDQGEKIVVWIKKLSYGELQTIAEVADIEERDEQWAETCKLVQKMTTNGDTDEPLFETIDAVGDMPWKIVQTLAKSILEANGAGGKAEETTMEAKND